MMRAIAFSRSVAVLALAGFCLIACASKRIDLSDPGPKEVPADVQQTLMARWNALAVNVTVPMFGDFRWSTYDQFPHPTFKGGSSEAYSLFADLLVAFFEKDDNFDFLDSNHLFKTPLRMGPNGQSLVHTSFQQLTMELGSNDWANISIATRTKLQDFAARMPP